MLIGLWWVCSRIEHVLQTVYVIEDVDEVESLELGIVERMMLDAGELRLRDAGEEILQRTVAAVAPELPRDVITNTTECFFHEHHVKCGRVAPGLDFSALGILSHPAIEVGQHCNDVVTDLPETGSSKA